MIRNRQKTGFAKNSSQTPIPRFAMVIKKIMGNRMLLFITVLLIHAIIILGPAGCFRLSEDEKKLYDWIKEKID